MSAIAQRRSPCQLKSKHVQGVKVPRRQISREGRLGVLKAGLCRILEGSLEAIIEGEGEGEGEGERDGESRENDENGKDDGEGRRDGDQG